MLDRDYFFNTDAKVTAESIIWLYVPTRTTHSNFFNANKPLL